MQKEEKLHLSVCVSPECTWVCFANSQVQSNRTRCHSDRQWPELNPSIAARWGHRTRHHQVDHWPHPWEKHKRETNEFLKPRPKCCPSDLRCVWHYWAERNEAIHPNAPGPRCKTQNNGQQLALADTRDLTWPVRAVASALAHKRLRVWVEINSWKLWKRKTPRVSLGRKHSDAWAICWRERLWSF